MKDNIILLDGSVVSVIELPDKTEVHLCYSDAVKPPGSKPGGLVVNSIKLWFRFQNGNWERSDISKHKAKEWLSICTTKEEALEVLTKF